MANPFSLSIWEPQKAFFCFKITTGGLIIGWFNLIASIITSLSLLFAIMVTHENLPSQIGVSVFLGVSISFVVAILSFVSSILLLVGISEGRQKFMMPFLIIRVIIAVVIILSGVVLFFCWVAKISVLGGFIILNIFTILTVVIVYEILIIRACKIKAEQGGPQCNFSTGDQNAYLVLERERNQD